MGGIMLKIHIKLTGDEIIIKEIPTQVENSIFDHPYLCSTASEQCKFLKFIGTCAYCEIFETSRFMWNPLYKQADCPAPY